MGKALTPCSEKNLKSQVPWKEEINNQPHLVLSAFRTQQTTVLAGTGEVHSTVLLFGAKSLHLGPRGTELGLCLGAGLPESSTQGRGTQGCPRVPRSRRGAAALLFWGKMKWPCQQPPVLTEFRINSASSGLGCY